MTFRIGEQYRANAGRAARVYPNMQRDRDYVLGTHDDEIDRLGLQQLRRRFFLWNTRSKAVKHHVQALNPYLFSELQETLLEALTHADARALCALVEALRAHRGGTLW